MSWINDLGSLANAAVNAAGTSGGQAAVGALVGAIKGNSQYAQAAQAQLSTLQVAFASTPPNTLSAAFALNNLNQMVVNGQLPSSIGPQLQLLSTPAIQANPVATAQAIAAISQALQH